MNPKPFSALNHFTVPVLTNNPSFLALLEPDRCSVGAGPEAVRELLEAARSRLMPNPRPTLYMVLNPRSGGRSASRNRPRCGWRRSLACRKMAGGERYGKLGCYCR